MKTKLQAAIIFLCLLALPLFASDETVVPTANEIFHAVQKSLNEHNPACVRLNLGPWLAPDQGETNILLAERFAQQKLLTPQFFTAVFNQKEIALVRYVPTRQGQPYFHETDEGLYLFCFGRPQVLRIDNIDFTEDDNSLRVVYRYTIVAIPTWFDHSDEFIALLNRLQRDDHVTQLVNSHRFPIQDFVNINLTPEGWQVDTDLGNDFVDEEAS